MKNIKFFNPYGLPAHIDMGSLSNRIGLMFNEDKFNLSELAKAARNTQWTDYSKVESAKLQNALSVIFSSYLSEEISKMGDIKNLSESSTNARKLSLSVIRRLALGKCNNDQVHIESWAVGSLTENLSEDRRNGMYKDMVALISTASNKENQEELIASLGVEDYSTLTSSVVVSDDLEYSEVMQEQRNKDALRRTNFVTIQSL